MSTSLRWQIALTMVRGLGPVQAKLLLTHFDIEEVFVADPLSLRQSHALTEAALHSLLHFSDWKRVEEEIGFIERNQIQPLFITEKDYPGRLLTCPDAPILLYYKGAALLNAPRMVSVVGTRGCTRQGIHYCEEIIGQLADYHVTINSGLAMGIDTAAHQSALHNSLPTLAVLPLGLDAIYPAANRSLASQILKSCGGLLTEAASKCGKDIHLFPRRNRLIAGLSDATIIIESATKGGSLITARLATDYGREVFALPGRLSDTKSKGCHALIKQQKAILIESGDDVAYWMGWEKSDPSVSIPPKEAKRKNAEVSLHAFESTVMNFVKNSEAVTIDQLSTLIQENPHDLAQALIRLELAGLIVSLPGNRYISVE